MIWEILILSLGLAVARELPYVEPEYLDSLRASGQDEEFARLLGIDVKFVRPDNADERSEGSIYNHVSHLGDIMLSEEQERQAINHKKYPGSRWPNGRIPYAITTSDFTSDQVRLIENSIADMNARIASNGRYVTLVKKTDSDRDYVQVFSGNGCWSYVGRIGGQQGLSLQRNGCVGKGTVQHEFGHAIGITHEQSRADRDDYVEVLWNNIPQNWHSQYQKEKEEDYILIGQYDYYSIMHYEIWAPETYKDAFRLKRNGDKNQMGKGQNGGLTDWDVYKINMLYWMN